MYIADMFCFGSDQNSVGVNGIRGCMGMFVSHGGTLYSIHMPPSSDDKNDRGRRAFAQYIRDQSGKFDGATAQMVCVVNNTERSSASDESYELCRLLGMQHFTLFRAVKFIEPDGTQPSAIAVVWQRTKGGQLELKYRMDRDVKWLEGQGAPRGGHYGAFRDDEKLSTTTEGWYVAGPPNAHGLPHHLI